MKFSPRSLALAVALASPGAWAADTYLNVFYQSNPLQGVEVKLDGQELGKTDKLGSAMADTPAGTHTLEILRDGVLVTTVNFETAEDEDAEISINYEEEGAEPKINIQTYSSTDKSVTGFVGGVVTGPDGSPLAGAEVAIADTAITATTDANGIYRIELPRGSYDVSIKHPDYAASYVDGVRVVADLGVAVSAKLKNKVVLDQGAAPTLAAPAGTMEEVITLGVWNPQETTIDMERFSTAVTDSIDVTQLARFGDSSAAAALTRIVGVSVSEGKYANVRGMDGRYISTTLNGFLLPSTDPLRRDVQLDLFPSSILGGIDIQKSYSADQLGTTTGGGVNMKTRGLPDERVFKISGSIGMKSDVTGEAIFGRENSNTDWYGKDDGLRELPGAIESRSNPASLSDFSGDLSDLELANLSVQLQDDYNPESNDALPDHGISIAFGDRMSLDSGEFGYYAAVDFDKSTSKRIDAEINFGGGLIGDYEETKENVAINAYLVAGLEFREVDEVLSKTILLRDTDNTIRVTDAFDDGEDNDVHETVFSWVERELIGQQFTGTHGFDIGAGHELDWRVGYSQSSRYEPDRLSYEYENGLLPYETTLARRWSDMEEDSTDFGIDYKINLEFTDNIIGSLAFGMMYSDKTREVDLVRISYGRGPNNTIATADINLGEDDLEDVFSYINFALGEFVIRESTADTDPYEADEEFLAYYASLTAEIGDSWTVVVGARQEEFTQDLRYPFNPDRDSEDQGEADSDEVLPSLAVTYRLDENWQFRGAISQTLSYPGMTEISESIFFDEDNNEFEGNPDLEVATIDNIDLRVEYYFADDQSVSLAYYQKDIENPVEITFVQGSGSAVSRRTFTNAPEATIEGIEIDGNFKLIDADDYLLTLSGNVSYIDSEVTLSGQALDLEGEINQGRKLQGQSPWLANLQLGFDHYETEQKVTLLVNYFDDKIYQTFRAAGTNRGPIEESGRLSLNLNYEKAFGESFTVKAQIKNLLNEEVERTQEDGSGVRIVESYETGTSFSVSASYEF